MRFFFDSTQRPTRNEFLVNVTPAYFELETRLSQEEMTGASYFYVLPLTATSALVASCWGREPDAIASLFVDPRMGQDWFKAFCNAYPTQGRLFENGSNQRYSEGALIRFDDPDDGEPKWSVVTVVGNLELGSEPDDPELADAYGLTGGLRFLCHSRYVAAYELVGGLSFQAAVEYSTNNIGPSIRPSLLRRARGKVIGKP